MPYDNPLSGVTGLINQRVDQGVDFTGTGPVTAIGDGTVITTSGTGWPGGPFMSYQLSDGPAAGKTVYVAEQITPNVQPGQSISAGDVIAQMHGYIETGWADPSGTSPESQTAQAGGLTGANLPPGGTLVGRNFEAFLNDLGVGKANNLGLATGGTLPSGYPDWTKPGALQDPSQGLGGPAPGTPASGSTCAGVTVFGHCLGITVPNFGADIIDWSERGALIILGAIFMLIGAWRLAGGSEEAVKSAAGKVAGNAARIQ